MRWSQTEFVLKGAFLGLVAFAALHAGTADEVPILTTALPWIGALIFLAVGLAISGWGKAKTGYKVRGRLAAFLLFLVLESPTHVFGGIILGMAGGVLGLPRLENEARVLALCIAGGAVLGLLFGNLVLIRERWTRLGLATAVAAGLVAGGLFWFGEWGELETPLTLKHPAAFGVQLLLGIPFFYLLTISGRNEESEMEMGAMVVLAALAFAVMFGKVPHVAMGISLVLVMFYVFYSARLLPSLKVFKHTLRGLGHAHVGKYRQALLAYRRALELNPRYAAAREGYWGVHKSLDIDSLAHDPETLALVDFDLCLNRATGLLLADRPTGEKLSEAQRLLNLVDHNRPRMKPIVDYWRAVAFTHAKNLDEASQTLAGVLDPAGPDAATLQRQQILLSAWKLALFLHPELKRRVGEPQLALPGRRMEAIAAVERRLAETPDDQDTWGLKRLLYQDVTEGEYEFARAGSEPPSHFDHSYVYQLGLALIDDPERRPRGIEYLRLAARGLPAQAPTILSHIARGHQKAGDNDAAWHYYQQARQAGLALGPGGLAPEERQAYYTALKLLADGAMQAGETQQAIENLSLYADYERSGVETLRTLARLYEAQGDVLAALRVTEKGLLYNAKDPDFLERKDRYYFSMMPQTFRERPELIPKGFDVDYCLRKARGLLQMRDLDFENLEWADHLAELAVVVNPESKPAALLLARTKLRRGERDEAVTLLKQVHGSGMPESFASGEEEEAWFLSCRLLGDIYLLELGKPDLAVPLYQEYRKSSKSGADTSFKLAQAYEQLGDLARAKKCYKQVTTFDTHPLAPDAREALSRLETSAK